MYTVVSASCGEKKHRKKREQAQSQAWSPQLNPYLVCWQFHASKFLDATVVGNWSQAKHKQTAVDLMLLSTNWSSTQ